LTQFEYIGVAVSLVLGLSIARLLEALRDAFDPTRRYWVHATWVVGKLANALVLFWYGWTIRASLEDTNFAQFVLILVSPAILFLQVHTLVTARPDTVTDWRTHFFGVRRWFFAANALLPLANFLALQVVAKQPFGVQNILLALVLVLSIAGFSSDNQRMHAGMAVLYVSTLIVGFGSLLVQSG
jgi:hypothetical protein